MSPQLPTVFRNDHWIVVDKPAGWLTVPSRMPDRDARACLRTRLEENEGARVFPVHRLDAEVSGLVLFARTEDAHRAACGWFEKREIKKHYHAWTENRSDQRLAEDFKTTWKSHLLRGKKRAYESSHGKLAITEAQLQKTLRASPHPLLLWVLSPVTGRSHQLRAHLSQNQFPILGDVLYGGTATESLPGKALEETGLTEMRAGIALRAVVLNFEGIAAPERLGLPEELAVKSWCDSAAG